VVVNADAETWLDGQHSEFFLSGFQKLEKQDKKWIELRGGYVEQISSLVAIACFFPGPAKDLSASRRSYTLITKDHCLFLYPYKTHKYPQGSESRDFIH